MQLSESNSNTKEGTRINKRIPAVLLAAWIAVGTLTACHKEMPGRLDGLYTSSDAADITRSQPSASDDSPDAADTAVNETFPVPAFKSGSYEMESSTANEQIIYSGANIVSHVSSTLTYDYTIKLTVAKDGSMKATYTFRRIRSVYEGSETAELDTDDPSGRTDDTTACYDLIGQSVTVSVGTDWKLSVKGVDKIHQKYPDTADIVTEENMKEVAADLFYPIDAQSLRVGSSWQLRQSGIVNTYTVAKRRDGSLYINIAGGKLDLPEPFTDDDITYTYTERAPLTGSLVMDSSDRMKQEQSSYQSNRGTLTYNGASYTFEETSSSLCIITGK